MLDRSHAAASRLNYQFYLWKETLHFNLHPSIPLPKEAHIADIATGTAIWLIDVARELRSARLDGFDIKLDQAPPPQWLPSNVKLRTWNIFGEVPVEMLGVYDVVHVRLLVLVVEIGDPRPVLRNLIKLLKPGGYLQWDELNYPGTRVKSVDGSFSTPALEELVALNYSQGRNNWTTQLADICVHEGLHDARLSHFEDRIVLAKANNELLLLTMEEFASRLEAVDKKNEAAKVHRLVKEVYGEALQGAAVSMPKVVCVARKPQNAIGAR